MRLPSHTCRVFTKDGTVKHLPTYKRPRRGVLIAVQHRSVWTMSPSVSTKIFSLVLLLAASATASPVEERGFFRWALLTGSWLSLNPVFWFRPQCLCVFVIFLHVFLRLLTILPKSVFRSGFSASPLVKPPALPPPPAAPLEDSSGRRQDLLTNSHRIISHKLSSRMSPIQSQENNVDLRSDLPRSLSQLLRPLSPTQRSARWETSGERILQVGWLFKICLHFTLFLWLSLLGRLLWTFQHKTFTKSKFWKNRSFKYFDGNPDFTLCRFACYGTCSAASFASTTSCTFGGLFWWKTFRICRNPKTNLSQENNADLRTDFPSSCRQSGVNVVCLALRGNFRPKLLLLILKREKILNFFKAFFAPLKLKPKRWGWNVFIHISCCCCSWSQE